MVGLLLICEEAISQAKQVLPVIKQPTFRKDTINIKKYGAVADGNTLNTKAINDAINAMHQRKGRCSIGSMLVYGSPARLL